MAGRQFVDMMPWVIASPSQFLAPGPPALGSTQWAQDFNETKLMGQDNSPSRTADETFYSSFWASTSSSYLWDIAAVSLAAERHTTLSENSRLLALLNVTMADAAIGCWKSKWTYQFWRPITAITAVAPGSSDGNPGTMEIKDWNPFLVTPAHQDYPSGHSCVSGAAGAVLSNFFGEQSSFVMTSDGMAGARYFPSFTAATDEVKNARVFAGIHFRTACNDGVALGISTANYVAGKAFGPANGNAKGQISH
jgi:hypothetical protein